MLLDGEWCQDYEFEPEVLYLKVGNFFTGIVQPGRDNDGGKWVAMLNGVRLAAHSDMDYAKARVESEIVNKLYNARNAIRIIRVRAPTSSDLYPDGAWERFKARQAAKE